jgi:excisionase family DNA binding protein
MNSNTETASPLSYTIAGAVAATGASRTRIYDALARGELEARKAGRRTVIEAEALRRWVASWPRATFGKAA